MACDETHTAENLMFFLIGFCLGFAVALIWMMLAGYLQPLPVEYPELQNPADTVPVIKNYMYRIA